MKQKNLISVGLIGCGIAGSRFLRALITRERKIGDIHVTAICDSDPTKLKTFNGSNVKIFTNARDMLTSGQYDVIILATNEVSHYDILCEIHKHSKKFKRLLVEKLLVETLKQANSIAEMFVDNDISIHFVERHSFVIQKLTTWLRGKDLKIRRASFFWGKYRLHDHRPTIGVISEISHPIDLVLMISGLSNSASFEILRGNYIFSDFSYSANKILDTINVNLKLGKELLVNGNSSFLWNERDRRISFYASGPDDTVSHEINIIFDNPYWDLDVCTINEIDFISGKRRLVERWEVKQSDISLDTLCVNKTSQFLEENIRELKGDRKSDILARLSQGVYIQKITDALLNDAKKFMIETPIFGACAARTSKSLKSDRILDKMFKTNYIEKDIDKLDKGSLL